MQQNSNCAPLSSLKVIVFPILTPKITVNHPMTTKDSTSVKHFEHGALFYHRN